jgi:hypothetical protein
MSDRVSNCSKVGSASKASHQILYGYLSIAQDGPQPARTQDFASVDRNSRRSPIWVAEKKVTFREFG